MEQELQVSLSGTIGEKIIIEVDHNSAAIGPDATKIKLMYQGTEDEIIKTIETGDVGLTLPGSQLLGYSSNKSGLFGIKVTGQVGRADFTVVASKQKAESSSKTFNATGGEVSDNVILSSQYLNNRFFRLDLPADEINGADGGAGRSHDRPRPDRPSASTSLQAARRRAPPTRHHQRGRLRRHDGTGSATGTTPSISRRPSTTASAGAKSRSSRSAARGRATATWWRSTCGGDDGDNDVLAVIYRVSNGDATVTMVGGRHPGPRRPRTFPTVDGTLLPDEAAQGAGHEPGGARLPLRPAEHLPAGRVEHRSRDHLRPAYRIERNQDGRRRPSDQDENGIWTTSGSSAWTRRTPGRGVPTDVVDWNDPLLFDLRRGLLKFPLDFPSRSRRFARAYEAYADTDTFDWDGHLVPGRQPRPRSSTTRTS